MFPRTLGLFMTWWMFNELVNHGPLKKYVYGEDKKEDPHHETHGHGAERHGDVTEAMKRARETLYAEEET